MDDLLILLLAIVFIVFNPICIIGTFCVVLGLRKRQERMEDQLCLLLAKQVRGERANQHLESKAAEESSAEDSAENEAQPQAPAIPKKTILIKKKAAQTGEVSFEVNAKEAETPTKQLAALLPTPSPEEPAQKKQEELMLKESISEKNMGGAEAKDTELHESLQKEPESEKEKSDTPVITSTPDDEQPTVFEIFAGKFADWLMVRGKFAQSEESREVVFASTWLLRGGTLLIIGSICYFIKLSIERGWMGPTGRVIMIIALGIAALAGGTKLFSSKRYAELGHFLSGIGLVALYIGFGLGHRFFEQPVIESAFLSFIALVIVTIMAAGYAIKLTSGVIAFISLIGGYLVPILTIENMENPILLYLYLLSLNIGAFFVARKGKWRDLDFFAALFATLFCLVRTYDFGEDAERSYIIFSYLFLLGVHAIQAFAVIWEAKSRSQSGNIIAWSGLGATTIIFTIWLCTYFHSHLTYTATGFAFLVLAVAQAVIAIYGKETGIVDQISTEIGIVFSTISFAIVPLYLFGAEWHSICLAVIALCAFRLQNKTGTYIFIVLDLLKSV